MKLLLGVALVMNAVLLVSGWNTIFLQTHWNDPAYIGLVFAVMGTPVVNAMALVSAWRGYSVRKIG